MDIQLKFSCWTDEKESGLLIMKYHLQYVSAVLRHKWYVFQEACKLGIPWRGLLHDFTKLSPGEWRPRVRAMRAGNLRGADGRIDLNRANDELALCWLRHYHRNSHHWQHWVVCLDNGTVRPLPMPDADRREMLADWLAVSRQPDRLDMIPWYQQNKEHLLLHPATRQWLEQKLGL